jgi:hypothetical protein
VKKPLFFNIEKLERETKAHPEYLVQALYYWYKNIVLPRRSNDPMKPLGNLHGSSFLLNPNDFFKDKTDINWKAQYIRLAGRRDLFIFNQYGIKTLDLGIFPDIDISAIKHNPLLEIASDKIHFKYED